MTGRLAVLSVSAMERRITRAVPDAHSGRRGRVPPPRARRRTTRTGLGPRALRGRLRGRAPGAPAGSRRRRHGFTWLRILLWTTLATTLFVVLVPPRVRAGAGWLSSRGLLRAHTVRTDRLVSVRWSDGVAQRLVLRDTDGCRVEVDPRVFVANPALWHRLDQDTRACVEHGTMLCGVTVLRQLAERIDRRTAQTVFQVSGLE